MAPEMTPEQIARLNSEAEDLRRAQWRGAIEQELQSLVQEASQIRTKIDTAKTAYKKTFYEKKFKKTSQKVMQMVAALQRLQRDVASAPTPDHIHNENCQHDHEEPEQTITKV